MRAISVRQPYAWLITQGFKDIENRDWPTKFRGRVLIHAGQTYSKAEYESDRTAYTRTYGHYPERDDMIGGIVGAVTITGCVTESQSEWFFGKYGFTLADARAIPLIQCKGALSFFAVPQDVQQRIRALAMEAQS